MSKITADDLLRNWAAYVWSGPTVGNMEAYVPWDDDGWPVHTDHAKAVEDMHKTLPWHERMVIIAEYPQRKHLFSGMTASERLGAARRWIGQTTGVWLSEPEYRIYLDAFKRSIERRLA